MLLDLYLSRPFLACFDNEGGEAGQSDDEAGQGGGEASQGGQDSGEARQGGGEGSAESRTFTQEEVNKFLADDRRKHQKKYESLEQSYQQLLENQSLSKQERAGLEESLESLRAQFRTKEQEAAHRRKQLEETYKTQLDEATRRAEGTWKMYETETISRSLQDAAVQHEAFHPSQIVTLLRGNTKLIESTNDKGKPTGKYEVMVDFEDRDVETGDPIVTKRTPAEAVSRMKELPDLYGNLFRANVVSGVGGSSATGGLQPGANGRVDVTKLTPAQYRQIRQENPELLGLTGRR